MKFSISQLQDFVRCPQLAHIKHVQLWDRAGGSPARTVGSMFHSAMEDKLLARPSRSAIELWSEIDNPHAGAIELWEKHRLGDVIADWTRTEEYGVPSAVEEVLEAPLGEHTLQGKLDSRVWRDGYWWSEQHKTYTDDLQSLTEKVRLSWHEVAYQYLLEYNGFSPVGGTILNACQKLPGYKLMDLTGSGRKTKVEVTLEMRLRALTTHHLVRTPQEQSEGLHGITYYAERMGEMFARPQHLARNNNNCFDMNGWKCPMFAHCWDGAELAEPMFIKLVDRYAPAL